MYICSAFIQLCLELEGEGYCSVAQLPSEPSNHTHLISSAMLGRTRQTIIDLPGWLWGRTACLALWITGAQVISHNRMYIEVFRGVALMTLGWSEMLFPLHTPKVFWPRTQIPVSHWAQFHTNSSRSGFLWVWMRALINACNVRQLNEFRSIFLCHWRGWWAVICFRAILMIRQLDKSNPLDQL